MDEVLTRMYIFNYYYIRLYNSLLFIIIIIYCTVTHNDKIKTRRIILILGKVIFKKY